MRRICHPYCILSLLAALFVLPAFFFGPHGGDSQYHLVWSLEFTHELLGGDLYPHWLSRMNSGCGSRIFLHYYPLPYYLTALFSFIDNPSMPGWYPLLAGYWVIFSLSGIFCHLWLASLTQNRSACFFGALVYMFFPFTTLHYQGGAYTSVTLMPWLPLLLLHAQNMAAGKRNGIPGFAVALAGLLTSTVLGVITMGWVAAAYFFFCARNNLSLRTFIRPVLAGGLGALLAAFYLVPMVSSLPTINLRVNNAGGTLYYLESFLFTNPSPSTHYSLYACVGMLVLWFAPRLWKTDRAEYLFWLAVTCVVFFMMTKPSLYLWQHVSLLPLLQLPKRFGDNILPLVMALFTMRCLALRPPAHTAPLIAVGIVMLSIVPSFFGALKPLNFYTLPEYSEEELATNPSAADEYKRAKMFKFLRVDDSLSSEIRDAGWKKDAKADALDALCKRKTAVESGKAEIAVQEWRARHIRLKVDAAAESTIIVSQFAFSSWVARDAEDAGITYPITPSPEGADLISITVPEGMHEVLLEIPRSNAEIAGAYASLAGIVLLLGTLAVNRRRKAA